MNRQPLPIAKLADGRPAWTPRALTLNPRRSGYVTQALINEHGSFRAALEWLNRSEAA